MTCEVYKPGMQGLITLLAPLSVLICTLFLVTTLLHVRYVLPTPICCRFIVSTQLLPPVVLALQPPQSATHSLLAFAILLRTLSVAFTKLTASNRPSAPSSGSPKYL